MGAANDRYDTRLLLWIGTDIHISLHAYIALVPLFIAAATYTANLASLLVDRNALPQGPESIEEVIVFKHSVCIWEGTFTDDFLKKTYKNLVTVGKPSLLEAYQGLENGDCDFVVDSVASWNKMRGIEDFNPYCDLLRVDDNAIIHEASAGFAVKADSGDLCTGYVRDVLDIHMLDMIADGFLEDAWEREHQTTHDIDCNAYHPNRDNGINRTNDRVLSETNWRTQATDDKHWYRRLKASSNAAAGGAVAAVSASSNSVPSEDDDRRLTVEQMIGTFVFHWLLCGVALLLAAGQALYNSYMKDNNGKSATASPKKMPTPEVTSDEASGTTELDELRNELAAMRRHMERFEYVVLRMEKVQSQNDNENPYGSFSDLDC